jgi:FAD/FMN-containing dehydrogenase
MQLPDGVSFERSDQGYEAARRATVWNARLPDRFPDVIVQAHTSADVQAALRWASSEGVRVGIRSGGHSWAANHVRDGGLLLDVSRLNDVDIDAEHHTAVVGPGTKGHELCAQLGEQGLFFPAGHCKGVAVGGYLLQGGYGWNSRVLGPACESVVGIDVVTAEGDAIHADEHENAELFWSARGSGPGFFGVVTAYHLKLYDKPGVCGSSLYLYPVELADEIYSWAHRIGPEVDRRVEMQILMAQSFEPLGIDQQGIVIASPVFADNEADAQAALSILETCPVLDQALVAVPYVETELSSWYDVVMEAYPDGHRYATDNMWTSASIDDLLPGIHRIAETQPPSPSHFLWLNWGPSPTRQDMAYSLEDEIYLALYGVWADAADDDPYADWPRSNMAAMAEFATGIQLADENLGQRAAPFATDDAMVRLDRARATYDPNGRFHEWMGRA